jgi:hypothetical protein
MIAGVLLAAALGAAPDPCAAVQPAAAPDAEAAAAYRAVGDSELAAGARGGAVLAYRHAAALDPGDDASRAALRRLCAEGPRLDPFKEALARMDAHDPRGAISLLRQARAQGDDPALMLLEGICQYDLGDDAAAEPLLAAAERSPQDAEVARLYLGLLALRAGATSRAATLFDAASTNPALGAVASDLARAARTQGPWALTLFAESGLDSNVTLASPRSLRGPQADGLYALGALAVVRPMGASGPYLRGQGLLTQQLKLDQYDVGALDLAVGWQLRSGSFSALAEYEYAYRTFGSSPFLTGNGALLSAWTVLGSATLGATYLVRAESYASGYSQYTGTLQAGEVRGSLPLGRSLRLALVYAGALDQVELGALSYVEHGPRAELTVAASRRVRLGLVAGLTFRTYDALDAALGVRRADQYLDGEAYAEWSLRPGWTARAGLRGRRASSNVAAMEYDKLVPTVGLAYTLAP